MPVDPIVVLHALTYLAGAMLLGSVLFLLFLVRPLGWLLGEAGLRLDRDVARIAGWSAQALVVCIVATLLLQGSGRAAELTPPDLSDDAFVTISTAGAAAAWLMALLLAIRWAPGVLLLPLGAVVLAAATLTSQAAAGPAQPQVLLAITALHLFGAAIWVGGIPAFLAALVRLRDGVSWHAVGVRFARMAVLGVAAILLSGAALAWLDVTGAEGDPTAFYGTAFGNLVSVKIVLVVALLALGLGNLGTLRRLAARPGTPVTRMKRFAEVQIGLGISLFCVAAALAPLPPPVDQPQDRVTWQQMLAEARPAWPRLSNPFAQPTTTTAIVSASALDVLPAAGPDDTVAWAGLFALAIGLLALLHRAGLQTARHWPLLLLPLAALLLVRADPAAWPLGPGAAWQDVRYPAALPQRLLAVLLVLLALIEWGAPRRRFLPRLLLPLATAAGGVVLLTSASADALTALLWVPLGLLGVGAGWTRWLELWLDPYQARWAGWVWPVCCVAIGVLLLTYPVA